MKSTSYKTLKLAKFVFPKSVNRDIWIIITGFLHIPIVLKDVNPHRKYQEGKLIGTLKNNLLQKSKPESNRITYVCTDVQTYGRKDVLTYVIISFKV